MKAAKKKTKEQILRGLPAPIRAAFNKKYEEELKNWLLMFFALLSFPIKVLVYIVRKRINF